MENVSREDVLRAVSEMRKMAELADVMEETGDPEGALAIRVAIHDRFQETAKVVDAATGDEGMTRVAQSWLRKLGLVAPKYGEELLSHEKLPPEVIEQLGREVSRSGRPLNESQQIAKLRSRQYQDTFGKEKLFEPTGNSITPRGYAAGGLAAGGLGALTLRGGKGPTQMPNGAGGIPMPGGGSVNPGDPPPTSEQLPTGPADIPYPGSPPPGMTPAPEGMTPAPVGMSGPQSGLEMQQMQQMGMLMQQMVGKMQELDMRLRNVGA